MLESIPRVLPDSSQEKAVYVDETSTNRPIDHSIVFDHYASDAISRGDGSSVHSNPETEMLLMRSRQHYSRSTRMFVPSQFPAGEALMQHVVFTFSKDPFQKIR